jgi:hypothetical protein
MRKEYMAEDLRGEAYQQEKPCSEAMRQLLFDMASDRVDLLGQADYVEAHALRDLLARRLDLDRRHDAVDVLRHILEALAAEVMPRRYLGDPTKLKSNLVRSRYQRAGFISRHFSTMLDLAWECDDVADAQEERKIEAPQTRKRDERHAYHTAQPAWCMDLVIQEPEERESTTNEKSRPALSEGGAPAHLCDRHRERWLAQTEEQRRHINW